MNCILPVCTRSVPKPVIHTEYMLKDRYDKKDKEEMKEKNKGEKRNIYVTEKEH